MVEIILCKVEVLNFRIRVFIKLLFFDKIDLKKCVFKFYILLDIKIY